LADLRQSLARKGRHLTAPMHALTCIEAAVNQPFDEGIKLEEKLFKELEASDQSRALRYAFFAERQAAKIPGVPQGYKAEPVRSVAVIGAGTMGSGIAIAYADARVTVKVLESSAEGGALQAVLDGRDDLPLHYLGRRLPVLRFTVAALPARFGFQREPEALT
jgi:hypothetical protein